MLLLLQGVTETRLNEVHKKLSMNSALPTARLGKGRAVCLPRARESHSHMESNEMVLARSCLKRIYPCFISGLEPLNQFCLLRKYTALVSA